MGGDLPLPTSGDDVPTPRARTLIEDLRAGDEGAYAVLFHEHFATLCNYAFSFVGSRDEATEVVQEVFVSLFLDRARLHMDERITVYLYGAVRHRALNVGRARRVRAGWHARVIERLGIRPAVTENDGAVAVLRDEIAATVRRLVDDLPLKCKDAFLLVRVHGISYDEAAAVLGVQRSTIQTHLMRATKILYRQLADLGLVEGAVRPGAGKRKSGARHDG